MDWQAAFNISAGAFSGLLGWLLRALWQEVKELKSDHSRLGDRVNAVEVLIAGKYQLREDARRDMDAILATLERIERRIDSRVLTN